MTTKRSKTTKKHTKMTTQYYHSERQNDLIETEKTTKSTKMSKKNSQNYLKDTQNDYKQR